LSLNLLINFKNRAVFEKLEAFDRNLNVFLKSYENLNSEKEQSTLKDDNERANIISRLLINNNVEDDEYKEDSSFSSLSFRK
jgi:hypothetical protein